MSLFRKKLTEAWHFSRAFLEWLAVSALIGACGGIVGSLFYLSISFVTNLREGNPWLIFLLPLGGLVIAALYRFSKTEGESTNDIIDSILLGTKVDILLLPVIFLSTVLTHLLGGSAGREGAALQIGGSLGCNIGRMLELDEKEERLAILSGMSAVFAALFGTPVTAAVFALEVCSVGIFHYSGLVPCGISALVAYYVTTVFHIPPTRFAIAAVSVQPAMVLRVCLLAALCALLSVLFCEFLHASAKLAAKLLPNAFLRAAVGGVLIIGMTLLVGNQAYNGGGVSVIASAIYDGQALPAAFLLKILFTAVTLACGFKGGEIVPTFFVGAAFGCVVGPLLGVPAQFAASVALVAMFCGGVNCPLASVILSVELFGSENIIYFAIVCFISYMLSGYSGLYSEQKIIYSKLKAEYINIKTD